MGRAFLVEQLVVGQPAEELHHLGFGELAAEAVLEHREQLADGLAAGQDLEDEELPGLEVVGLVGELVAQQVRRACRPGRCETPAGDAAGRRAARPSWIHSFVFAFAVGAASGESLTLQPPPMAL